MEPNPCWHCGSPAAESLFCRFCNSLQRPTPDYYEFFGFEHQLSLDVEELDRRFYSLSRRLHPDLFFRAMPREQQFSLEATAILNDAYRTLRDPVARAEYLLKELGEDPAQPRRQDAPPELLEEVFELNELLEESRGTGRWPVLQEAHKKFLRLRAEADRELEGLFGQYDRSADRALLPGIRSLLSRRRYIHNLIEQLEKELAP
jgi:molecular chaperone HscB